MSDVETSIKDSAVTGIKRAQNDSGSTEMHSLKDMIEVDRYISGKKSAKRGMKGILRQRAVPPGTA